MSEFLEFEKCTILKDENVVYSSVGGGTMSEDIEKYKIGNEQYVCVAPIPCVRDEHGEIKEQSVIKQLIGKVNEELDELKETIVILESKKRSAALEIVMEQEECVADEAADTITAITTLLEALGIDAKMRDEAQRRVNSKNMERGRL